MPTRRRLITGVGGLLVAETVLHALGWPSRARSADASIPQAPRRDGRVLYVAPGGSDETGQGSLERPFATLPRAYADVVPGDTIRLRGGRYTFREATAGWLVSGRGGAPDRPIRIENHPGEVPTIDGGDLRPLRGRGQAWASRRTAGGFPLALWDTPHVELRGITVCNGPMGGIHVNGAHDGLRVERCVTRDNGWLNDEHGVGLGVYGTGHANVVRNCDSHGNHGGGPGATGGNADGFQITLHESDGTVVVGNRAWRNGDDGFDFYDTAPPGDSRRVTNYLVDGNWSFENGCHADGTPNAGGDGVGFKLGGRRPGSQARHGGHVVTRCVSWNNKTHGFDDNGYNGGTEPHVVFNNTTFNNGTNPDRALGEPGYAFVFQDNPGTRLCNNVAFATQARNELLVEQAFESHNLRNGRPWNVFDPPLSLDRSDFRTLDDARARGARAADGTLPASDFLRPCRDSRLNRRGTSNGLPAHLRSATFSASLGAFEADD